MYDGSYSDWLNLLNKNFIYSLSVWDFETKQQRSSKLNMVKTFYEGNNPKCVLVANLSTDVIDTLFHDNEFAYKRKIFLTDSHHNIISSNTSEAGMNICDAFAISGSAFEEDNGNFRSNKYMVSYKYIDEIKLYFII
jgi:hypothetical protein